MEEQETIANKPTKLTIPTNAKIKVYWDDVPENYSKENKVLVRNHFATKYGVSKTNINVVYRPIKITDKGETIEINGAGIDNIMDTSYQRELFKEWLTRESKDVDFGRLMKLDDKVNAELNETDNGGNHREWSLKWIMMNGFLCFGPNNFVSLSNLNGLTIVNSYPENQGGKTTFSIDAFKFVLYGKTTKTDKNEEVFNQYWDNDELVVRGMLSIIDKEIIIERKMTRKKKRNGGWNIENKLNLFEVLPDGEEIQMNDEDAKATTEEIRKVVGVEADFELVTLATARNLDDLVGLTTTESGKLLTRFIGLDPIERKSEASRKMYNEFAKTKKSNMYDETTLKNEIDGYIDETSGLPIPVHGHTIMISQGNELLISQKDLLAANEGLITKYNDDKDTLLTTKKTIDAEILTLNPSKLVEDIKEITNKGVKLNDNIEELQGKIKPLIGITFDEDRHQEIVEDGGTFKTELAVKTAEINRLKKVIEDLIAGGICQACNRALDNIDNTAHIAEHNKTIKILEDESLVTQGKIDKLVIEINSLNELKEKVDSRQKFELNKDRLEIEVESLRTLIKSKQEDQKKYTNNLDAIESNKDIDTKVDLIKTKLSVCDHTKTEITQKIERTKMDITTNETAIVDKNKIIAQIKKESEVEKLFKVYIDMVGKKGISKLVLRSVLPIINSEVQRLLDGVTDFEVEIFINDKNDVQFMLIKDDVEKYLKSGSGLEITAASIALRCVLGKMSCLPMPNFITFDEVLGKVANVNIPHMKPLFDKITDMYDTVFFITHNEVVKDWGDNIITIKKENNVSSIYVK
jgi:DNA repair exonuclease SbcCD ATPase subunit